MSTFADFGPADARAMPAPDPPPTFEVPEIARPPEARSPRQPAHPVELADHLLTVLLRHEAGLLHADYGAGGGRWHVRGWTTGGPSGHDEVVVVTEGLGYFRSILARFGHHYLSGQLYGGFAEGRLSQGGRAHHFAMYMANDQWRGYWLRAYVREVVPSAPPGHTRGSV